MNVKHQAVWCQNDNDINVEHQTIYVRLLNDERQNVLTFECGTSNSLMFDIKMSHSNNEHQITSSKNIMLSYIYPFSEITQIWQFSNIALRSKYKDLCYETQNPSCVTI